MKIIQRTRKPYEKNKNFFFLFCLFSVFNQLNWSCCGHSSLLFSLHFYGITTLALLVNYSTLKKFETLPNCRWLCHLPFVKVSSNHLQIWIFGNFLSATPFSMETYSGSANVFKLKIYFRVKNYSPWFKKKPLGKLVILSTRRFF
jgi:hypothetical protein